MIANLKVHVEMVQLQKGRHGSDIFHKRGGSRKIRESHSCFFLLVFAKHCRLQIKEFYRYTARYSVEIICFHICSKTKNTPSSGMT